MNRIRITCYDKAKKNKGGVMIMWSEAQEEVEIDCENVFVNKEGHEHLPPPRSRLSLCPPPHMYNIYIMEECITSNVLVT